MQLLICTLPLPTQNERDASLLTHLFRFIQLITGISVILAWGHFFESLAWRGDEVAFGLALVECVVNDYMTVGHFAYYTHFVGYKNDCGGY